MSLKQTEKNIIYKMDKKNYYQWVYHLLVIGSLLFLLFNQFFRNEKLAYVDSGKIMNDYKASVDAKKAYQSKAKNMAGQY